jgi:hypothetical protein
LGPTLTSIRAGGRGHEKVGKAPNLPVDNVPLDRSPGHLVRDSVSSIPLDPVNRPGLFLRCEEGGLFGKVDDEQHSGDTEDHGDDAEEEVDWGQRGTRDGNSLHCQPNRPPRGASRDMP